MIGMKLKEMRKQRKMSLEYVAEQISVSRQTLANWEADETVPDILKCKDLAELYEVSLDDIALGEGEEISEKRTGKYIFGMVKVGERGQIVIPQKARKVFDIQAGDQLLVLGDVKQGGMAVMKVDELKDMLPNV
ncbi:MAG: helix-turn-helix domain-containing protein [Bacteroidales bacterium]|nr:helix-turn-helix domain-containing protein [Clostridium sp.]MCM1203743.1 helix-turn-helix domain-containing protein [Bacteroidales bacterium]